MILQLNYKLFLFIYLFIELHFSFFYALCHNSIHKSPIILYIYHLYISNALHKTSSPFFFFLKSKALSYKNTNQKIPEVRQGRGQDCQSFLIYLSIGSPAVFIMSKSRRLFLRRIIEL